MIRVNKKNYFIAFLMLLLAVFVFSFGKTEAEGTPTLNYSELVLFPGQHLQLKFDSQGLETEAVQFYADDTDLITVDQDGNITATDNTDYIGGSADTYIAVTYSYKVGTTAKYFRTIKCNVTVAVPTELILSDKPVAKGVRRKIDYKNEYNFTNTKMKWATETPKISSVNSKGIVKGKKEGTAIIKAIFYSGKDSFAIKSEMPVTNPRFVKKKIALCLFSYSSRYVTDFIEGMNEHSILKNLKSSSTNKISVDRVYNTIYPKKLGDAIVISCKVDGKLIKAKFYVDDARIMNSVYYSGTAYWGGTNHYYVTQPVATRPGKTFMINFAGTKSFSTYEFSSDKPKIATVSKKGKVRAVSQGTTYIKVKVDGYTYKFHVVVSKDQRIVDVVNRASSAIGCVYSQQRRMDPGYYDCSSLVYRCYSPSGCTFGVSGWAPTADYEARQMANTGRMIAWDGGLSHKKLKAGDIIFFGGYYDWQWRSIGHVAIYIGDDTIIHASGGLFGVFESNYTERRPRVSCIARPF